jgi:Ca2+-binding RTX toxin-like protein
MATYYVDSKTGNDDNSGINASSAWRSIEKVNTHQFLPGDQVLLKRGNIFTSELLIKNSGTATAPIKVGAYGSGANPLFDGSVELKTAKWSETSPGSHIWTTPVTARGGEDPGRIKFNKLDGNIEAAHSGAVAKAGDWYWSGGVLSVYSMNNPSSAFQSVALQVDNNMVKVSSAKHVVLQNIDVTMARYGFNIANSQAVTLRDSSAYSNTMNGFTIGNSTSVVLQGGSAYENGRDGEGSSTMHIGHGVLITGASSNNLVEGMRLYANSEDGVQFGPNVLNGNVISNNEIFRNREDGIDIKGWGNKLTAANFSVSFNGNNIYGNTELGININADGTMRLNGNYVESSDGPAIETGDKGAVISTNNVYVGANSSTVALWASNRTSTFAHDAFVDGGLRSTISVDVSAGSNHVFEDSSFIMRNTGKALMIGGSASNVTLKSNTFYSEGAFLVRFNEGKSIISDYNHYYRGDNIGGWFQVSTANGWKTYGGADLQSYATDWGIDQHSAIGRPVTVSEGTDALVGSASNDSLNGKGGNDVLFGRAGADILNGGLGTDMLIGDAGSDTFVFSTGLSSATNVDRVRDFNVSDDAIYLDNAVFRNVGSGTIEQPAKLDTAIFTISTKAQDASDRIIYDSGNGHLFYDVDGSGQAKQTLFAVLPEHLKLTGADFFVI